MASINFYSLNIEQNPKRIPSYSRKINWEKLRPIQLGPRSISRYTVFLNLPRLLLYVHLQYNILLANTVQAGYTKSLLTVDPLRRKYICITTPSVLSAVSYITCPCSCHLALSQQLESIRAPHQSSEELAEGKNLTYTTIQRRNSSKGHCAGQLNIESTYSLLLNFFMQVLKLCLLSTPSHWGFN